MTDTYFNFKDLTVEKLNEYKGEVMVAYQQTLDQIVNEQGERTFENTIQPLINLSTIYETMVNIAGYATNFYPNKEVRDTGSAIEGELSKFLVECSMRKDVYQAFIDYQNTSYLKERSNLTDEEVRSFEHTIRDFRRNGLHLDDPELVELKKELSDLCVNYSKNMNEENTSFEFTKQQLDGMPESWFTDSRCLDKDKTLYKVTLKYPDIVPALEYLTDSSIRKQLYTAYKSRCGKENTPIFEKAVNLRHRIAQKLGYKTHADYKTEVKIVKNGQNALDFLENLNNLLTPAFNKEMEDLTTFAQSYEDNPLAKDKLDKWDISYYMRLYKEYLCNFDMEKVKEYFPLDRVKDGLFKIYQDILSLKFAQVDTDNVWHESVTLYVVNDAETDELLGYFYLDMHPREGKYGHAAAFDFMTGCDMTKVDGNSGRRPHIMTMACNFPESGCISFSDVVTFFHEFGHIMHQICSKSQLSEFSGFHVEWDFVEAPSQMLENWCYTEEALKLMSSHKDTGEPIGSDLVEKLKKSKYVMRAYRNKRQLMFGLFDLRTHTMDLTDKNKFSAKDVWYKNEADVMGFDEPEDCYPWAAFGHLMGGYDAGYYGYLRSETYATNMFYVWFKGGRVLSKESGIRYRRKLLEPGSTKDGLDLLRNFLGEEPNDSYFLKECGL